MICLNSSSYLTKLLIFELLKFLIKSIFINFFLLSKVNNNFRSNNDNIFLYLNKLNRELEIVKFSFIAVYLFNK